MEWGKVLQVLPGLYANCHPGHQGRVSWGHEPGELREMGLKGCQVPSDRIQSFIQQSTYSNNRSGHYLPKATTRKETRVPVPKETAVH